MMAPEKERKRRLAEVLVGGWEWVLGGKLRGGGLDGIEWRCAE
jgi:hypothetical protein